MLTITGLVNVAPASDEKTSWTRGLSSASVYQEMATRLSLAAAEAALTGQALISHLSGFRFFGADVCSCCPTSVVNTAKGFLVAYRGHTPKDIREKLNAKMAEIAETADMKAKMLAVNVIVPKQKAEEMRQYLLDDIARNKEVIARNNIKVE